MNEKIIQSFGKTWNAFKHSMPILFGILLLISLANTLIPKEFYSSLFTKNAIIDSFIGALFGSIAAGNPITSYIIGGELLKQGISIIAITAFIVSWVTVGIIQFPAESFMLGKRFAVARNIVSFVTAIIIAIATAATLGVFH